MPKFSASRSITIESDPITVFNKVSDFDNWTTWSPWLVAEPDAKVEVSADSNSVGSIYQWDGNVVGAGELEHMQLEPGKRIGAEIRFKRPWKSQSDVAFNFEQVSGGTEVTWSMNGALPWFMFWMIPMMEPFIGMDYDRGLRMLKEWIETGKINSDTQCKDVQEVGPIRMAGVRGTSSVREIAAMSSRASEEAKAKLEQHGVSTDGVGISAYHDFKIKKQLMEFTSGFEVDQPVDIPGVENWSIERTHALRIDHVGSYGHLGNGWYAANQIAQAKKLKKKKRVASFEIYRNIGQDVAVDELITEIYLPLK